MAAGAGDDLPIDLDPGLQLIDARQHIACVHQFVRHRAAEVLAFLRAQARGHLAALDVARAPVVDHHEAANGVQRLFGRGIAQRLAQHGAQFQLVIQRLGETGWLDGSAAGQGLRSSRS